MTGERALARRQQALHVLAIARQQHGVGRPLGLAGAHAHEIRIALSASVEDARGVIAADGLAHDVHPAIGHATARGLSSRR